MSPYSKLPDYATDLQPWESGAFGGYLERELGALRKVACYDAIAT